MKRTSSFVWGIILLLVGILMTLSELNIVIISRALYAPIVMLAIGLIFHLYYFLSHRDNEGLLVPGGILLTYGLLFLLDGLNIAKVSMLWPLFILGPALGLFELYAFSGGRTGSMIPVFILTAIGGSFLLMNFGVASFEVVLAAVLIVLGVGLMVNAFYRNGGKRQKGWQGQTGTTQTPPQQEAPASTAASSEQAPSNESNYQQ